MTNSFSKYEEYYSKKAEEKAEEKEFQADRKWFLARIAAANVPPTDSQITQREKESRIREYEDDYYYSKGKPYNWPTNYWEEQDDRRLVLKYVYLFDSKEAFF